MLHNASTKRSSDAFEGPLRERDHHLRGRGRVHREPHLRGDGGQAPGPLDQRARGVDQARAPGAGLPAGGLVERFDIEPFPDFSAK